MKITFWGATQQVSGSMYLLETADGLKILIDCGYDLENGNPITDRYPCDPFEIDYLIVTHAHIDHTGHIPSLQKAGFEGKIFCTTPTYALTQLLLADSASLNRQKAYALSEKKSKKNRSKLNRVIDSLYFQEDVEEVSKYFQTVAFNQEVQLAKHLKFTFLPTGHLVGAAAILISFTENNHTKTILFSGDIGRNNYPLLVDPQLPPQVDYMVSESTYGNRNHKETRSPEDVLLDVIVKTCVEAPGRLIIPAFSVGRSQAILHILHRLYTSKLLPSLPVYVDSPLAIDSTKVHEKMVNYLHPSAQNYFKQHGSIFDFDHLTYVHNAKKSRQLANYHEPCIILSSSGMIEGGRVQHHVSKNLQNPQCTILISGYVAENTFAWELLHGKSRVYLDQKTVDVRCNIQQTDVFSGHASQADLLTYIKTQNPQKLTQLFLTHGDKSAMEALSEITKTAGYNTIMPAKKSQFLL